MTSQEKTTAKCSEQRRPPRGGPHCTARLCPQGPRPGGCGLAPAGQKHALLLDTARSARSSPAAGWPGTPPDLPSAVSPAHCPGLPGKAPPAPDCPQTPHGPGAKSEVSSACLCRVRERAATYLQHGLDGERGVPDLRAVGALRAEGGLSAAARAGSSCGHRPPEAESSHKEMGTRLTPDPGPELGVALALAGGLTKASPASSAPSTPGSQRERGCRAHQDGHHPGPPLPAHRRPLPQAVMTSGQEPCWKLCVSTQARQATRGETSRGPDGPCAHCPQGLCG